MDTNQERLVLDDVSFVVESGTALAVCGPSGCGKSTLLNLIAGREVSALGGGLVIATHNESIASWRGYMELTGYR